MIRKNLSRRKRIESLHNSFTEKKKKCIRMESYRDRQQQRSGRTFKETRYRYSRLFSLCSRLELRACPYITPRYLCRAFTRIARNFHLANFSLRCPMCRFDQQVGRGCNCVHTVTRKSIARYRFDLAANIYSPRLILLFFFFFLI